MRRVVMLSGGVGSWAAAKRVAETHGTDGLTLLFADTKMEDVDTYRFLREGAANVGGELVEIADGRDIWQVFEDRKFLGTSRVDPCSDILKRKMCDRWLTDNRDPSDTVVYVGIDWTEVHRYERLKAYRAGSGWTYEAPLCEAPYLDKNDLHAWATRVLIRKTDGITAHTLRHTCATWLAQADVQLGKIAILLGDTVDTIDRHYAHHCPKDLDQAINRIGAE